MLKWIKDFFNKPDYVGEIKIKMPEDERYKMFNMICNDECPDCGSKEGFYEGPSGGMSTNIFCANKECGHRFNITPALSIAERV